jgi:hypothetical protein
MTPSAQLPKKLSSVVSQLDTYGCDAGPGETTEESFFGNCAVGVM